VIDGYNGLHARTLDDWERNLERLIESAQLRALFGANGRTHVGNRYSMRAYQDRYLSLLSRLAAA
jgi:hypothetical protein